MDILDVLAICAGNAIGVLLVQAIAALWRRHRRAATEPRPPWTGQPDSILQTTPGRGTP